MRPVPTMLPIARSHSYTYNFNLSRVDNLRMSIAATGRRRWIPASCTRDDRLIQYWHSANDVHPVTARAVR